MVLASPLQSRRSKRRQEERYDSSETGCDSSIDACVGHRNCLRRVRGSVWKFHNVPQHGLASISVTGSAPVVGATSQLAAAAVLSDGTTQDVTSVATWQSSDTSLATVSSTGLVTGIAEGAVVVQAAYSGVTGSMSITIP